MAMMNKPRCGVMDKLEVKPVNTIRYNSLWIPHDITYNITRYSDWGIDHRVIDHEIARAFKVRYEP